jgi:hypothetical protein
MEASAVGEMDQDRVTDHIDRDRRGDQGPHRPWSPTGHPQDGDHEHQAEQRTDQEQLRQCGRSMRVSCAERWEQQHGGDRGSGKPGQHAIEREHRVESADPLAREQSERGVGEAESDEQHHLRDPWVHAVRIRRRQPEDDLRCPPHDHAGRRYGPGAATVAAAPAQRATGCRQQEQRAVQPVIDHR